MAIKVQCVVVRGSELANAKRLKANKHRAVARVITNLGIINMRVADLPYLADMGSKVVARDLAMLTGIEGMLVYYRGREDGGNYIESIPEALQRLHSPASRVDYAEITAGLNQNPDFLDKNVCHSFALAVWKHFAIRPYLDFPEIIDMNMEHLGYFHREKGAFYHGRWEHAVRQVTEAEFGSLSHLDLLFLDTVGDENSHHAVVVENPDGTKAIWEKDMHGLVTLTPLEQWENCYTAVTKTYLAIGFSAIPRVLHIPKRIAPSRLRLLAMGKHPRWLPDAYFGETVVETL